MLRNPAMDVTRFSSHLACMLLAMLSSAAFATVEIDRASSIGMVRGLVVVDCVVTLLVGLGMRRLAFQRPTPAAISPLLVFVFLGSCLFEPLMRAVFDSGRPFEMLLGFSLKNTILLMSAAGCWKRYQHLAVTASLFLQMFCLTLLPRGVWPVTLAFALLALWWLMNSHWEQVARRLQTTGSSRRQAVPRGAIYVAIGLVIGICATELLTDHAVTRNLSGVLPSSGGTGECDPFARDGVGDGDALVAGSENIQSFAPIEDAPFKSSDEPSLYDVYNDMYEEPKLVKNQSRAIALPNQQMEDLCCRMAKSEMAGRQFSTLRQTSKARPGQMKDLKSEALFYVAGRTPLHLRQELYDLYDGVTWFPEDGSKIQSRLTVEEVSDRPWITLSTSGMAYNNYNIFGRKESHALKIAHLDTNVIPAPNRLLAVHIDKLDDPTMLKEVQHGLLAVDGKKVPSMLPVHLSTRTLDTRRIDEEIRSYPPIMTSRELPADEQFAKVKDLAITWGAGLPKGVVQISQIVDRLKERCKLDTAARPIEESNCIVHDFLFDTKAGPDYQFASATAVLLRSLGYGTRLVSGYYAHPDKYDRRSRHTPVHKEDLHFWVEVYLGANVWLTIEPTPGYVVLGPPPTIWEQAWATAVSLSVWVNKNLLALLGWAAVSLLLIITRAWWIDAIRTLDWHLRPGRPFLQRVIITQQILEARFAVVGEGRRKNQTFQRWSRQRSFLDDEGKSALSNFARVVEMTHYSLLEGIPDQKQFENEFRQASDIALKRLTLPRLHSLKRASRKRAAILNRTLSAT